MINKNKRKKAIICDLDETLIYNPIFYEDFEVFRKHVLDGIPNEWCVTMVNGFHKMGVEIIFLTARDISCKLATMAQIKNIFGSDFSYKLCMRESNDFSSTVEMKEAHLKRLMRKYDILLCIDDDYENCEMFSQYIPTLKVECERIETK